MNLEGWKLPNCYYNSYSFWSDSESKWKARASTEIFALHSHSFKPDRLFMEIVRNKNGPHYLMCFVLDIIEELMKKMPVHCHVFVVILTQPS